MSAEFRGNPTFGKISSPPNSGFNAVGAPVPMKRRLAADQHLKEMGVQDVEDRFHCIQNMSNKLERSDPYGAMECGMRYVDLTGTYRLMAVLLCD